MEQFVRRIYEYRNHGKGRDAGFVRIEKMDSQIVLHIHGRGFRLEEENMLELYFYHLEDGIPVVSEQGIIENVNPALNRKMVCKEDQIQGLILKSPKGRLFFADWKEETVPLDQVNWQQELEEKKPEEKKPEEKKPEEKESGENREEEGNSFSCRKITREELSVLPKSEWKLANNRFLMHGYYNYHHLILIREGEELWVGVPGVYHRREARAAEGFGFTSFQPKIELELDLDEEEKDTSDKFGYWCRKVKQR